MKNYYKVLGGILIISAVLIFGWWVLNNQPISQSESECKADSDCELVYVGQDVCPPCDTLSEEYQCLNESEKIKAWDKWDKSNYGVVCSPCELEFNRYVCECENGKCEKVKEELKEQITITTDKTEYEQGETVKTTVRNNLDKSIWFNGGPSFGCSNAFSIGVKENKIEEFYLLEMLDCIFPSLELKTKSEQVLNLKLDNHFNEWLEIYNVKFPAIYKLEFNYGFTEENSKIEKVYSNEFTIKEKSSNSEVVGINLKEAQKVAENFFELEKKKDYEGLLSMQYLPSDYDQSKVKEENRVFINVIKVYNKELGDIIGYSYKKHEGKSDILQTSGEVELASLILAYEVEHTKHTVDRTITIVKDDGKLKVDKFGILGELSWKINQKIMESLMK